MAKRTGIEAATREVMTTAPAPSGGGDPEQPELFPEIIEPERKAGRPAGSVSLRTRDFLDYLDKMPDFELPGLWLAKRYSSDVTEILRECGLAENDKNRQWADNQRQDAAKALAPYVHERRPQAVEVDDRRAMKVTVQALDADGNEIMNSEKNGGEFNLAHLLMGRPTQLLAPPTVDDDDGNDDG